MNLEQTRKALGTNMYIEQEPGESVIKTITRANKEGGWKITGLSWAAWAMVTGEKLPSPLPSIAPEFGRDDVFVVSNNNNVRRLVCRASVHKVGNGNYIFLIPTGFGA